MNRETKLDIICLTQAYIGVIILAIRQYLQVKAL